MRIDNSTHSILQTEWPICTPPGRLIELPSLRGTRFLSPYAYHAAHV